MQAGIIGLGLIGGSLGLALRESKMFKRIFGFDNKPLHAQQALSLGVVDECISLKEIEECDVIFVSIPMSSVVDTINGFCNLLPTQTIIDLSSAKSFIKDNIKDSVRKNYVGAHPMNGTEYSGPKAAQRDLFKDKILILTDTEDSGEFQVSFAKEIFVNLGMRIVKMDSKNHDEHVAYISHLPHIISFALANTVLVQESPENILALVGGGFKSMSRLANSHPITWRDIFRFNKKHLMNAIVEFEGNLSFAKNLIENENYDELEKWMKKANGLRDFM